MQNGCPALEDLLALVHGELEETERAKVARHAEGCDDCQAAIDRVRLVARTVEVAGPSELPESLVRGVLSEIRRRPTARRRATRRVQPLTLAFWIAGAAAAFLVIAIGLRMGHSSAPGRSAAVARRGRTDGAQRPTPGKSDSSAVSKSSNAHSKGSSPPSTITLKADPLERSKPDEPEPRTLTETLQEGASPTAVPPVVPPVPATKSVTGTTPQPSVSPPPALPEVREAAAPRPEVDEKRPSKAPPQPLAPPQPPSTLAQLGRLVVVQGPVTYRRMGSGREVRAQSGVALLAGDRLFTRSGRVVLEVSEGAAERPSRGQGWICVDRNSELRLLALRREGHVEALVELVGGRVVIAGAGRRVHVATNDGLISPVGTHYGVTKRHGLTWVGLQKGAVTVTARATAGSWIGSESLVLDWPVAAASRKALRADLEPGQEIRIQAGRAPGHPHRAPIARLMAWAEPLLDQARPPLFAETFDVDRPGIWTHGHRHGHQFGSKVEAGRLVFLPQHHIPGPSEAFRCTRDGFPLGTRRVVTVSVFRPSAKQDCSVRIIAQLPGGGTQVLAWTCHGGREAVMAPGGKLLGARRSAWQGARRIRIELDGTRARVRSGSARFPEVRHGWGPDARIRIELTGGTSRHPFTAGVWVAFDDLILR